MKRVTVLTGLVLGALIALAPLGCVQQKKSVRLRFTFTPRTIITHTMEQKRQWRVVETIAGKDSTTEKGLTTVSVVMQEEIRRVLEDSTAEILHTNTWSFVEPSMEDTTRLDTIRGSRSYTSYVKPNGRLVDLEFPDTVKKSETEYLRSLYEQAATVLPDGMVEQGKTWSHSKTVMLGDEKVNATTEYELKSFFRKDRYDCAVVGYKGNIIIPIKPDPADSSMREGLDKIDFTGEMYFAYAEGVIVTANERWLVDSYRKAIKDGKEKEHRYLTESDVDFRLKDVKPIE